MPVRSVGLLLSAAWLVPAARADDVTDSADAVLSAVAAGEIEAVATLAARGDPDPWLVADDLCSRGRFEAARIFAASCESPSNRSLAAHVADVQARPPPAAARAALAAARDALREKRWEDVLAAAEGGWPADPSVVGARLHLAAGFAHRALFRLPESASAFRRSAVMGEAIGWLRVACEAWSQCGESEYRRSDWSGALDAWTRRLKVAQELGDSRIIANTLGDIGLAYDGSGKSDEAVEYLGRALEAKERLGDRAGAATTLMNLGNAHFRRGRFDLARAHLETSLAVLRELGLDAEVARAQRNLGELALIEGGYVEARVRLDESARIRARLGDAAGEAIALATLGQVLVGIEEYAEADRCLNRASELARRVGNRECESAVLDVASQLCTRLGDRAGAARCAKECLELEETLGVPTRIARARIRLAVAYDDLGDEESAFALLNAAIEVLRRSSDATGIVSATMELGRLHESRGRADRAADCYRDARQRAVESGLPRESCDALRSLLLLYGKRKSDPETAMLLQEARAAETRWGARPEVAILLGAAGLVMISRERFDESREIAARGVSMARALAAPAAEAYCLGSLVTALIARARWAEALEAGRRGAELLPYVGAGLADDELAAMRERFSTLLAGAREAAYATRDARAFLEFFELGRATALHSTLRDAGAARGAEETTSKEAEARRATAEARLRHAAAVAAGSPESPRTLQAWRTARENLLALLRTSRRGRAQALHLADRSEADVARLRATLARDEAGLVIATGLDAVLVLVIDSDEERLHSLPLEPIRDLMRRLMPERAASAPRGLALPSSDASLSRPGTHALDAVSELRATLLDPLAIPPARRRLVVIPDGEFAWLPFGLLAPDREVCCVPSVTFHCMVRRENPPRGGAILAFGHPATAGRDLAPIPRSAEEAKAIGDEVLTGEAASESNFGRRSSARSRWRSIHVACHAITNTEHPLESFLALAPDPDNDGDLTIREALSMEVPADLVALSACHTAAGRLYDVEGAMGFPLALLQAGASRVLVSLWNVDDEATEALMVRFYELWNPRAGATGIAASTALKRAQEFVASQERWKHPCYWAAWQLWGDPR